MNPSTETSWWQNATTEQRLAQIDGGLECGMTSGQVAVASRTSAHNIRQMAVRYGRHFPSIGKQTTGHRLRKIASDSRRAYLRGEPIDLWGNTEAQEEFLDEVVS